jgi:isopentenyl-diphosphate Delta-isomerase
VAANRRLGEEIGVEPVALTEIGVHTYQATDPVTGRTEHEYDHVLLGSLDAGVALRPDPQEVAQLRWVSPQALRAGLTDDPDTYAPWLTGVAGHLFALGRQEPGSALGRQDPGAASEGSGGRGRAERGQRGTPARRGGDDATDLAPALRIGAQPARQGPSPPVQPG